MKKIIFSVLLFTLCGGMSLAQNQDEERSARMQERKQQQTESLIKDLKLTADQDSAFRDIYTRYQNELATTIQLRTRDSQKKDSKKELTDAEALAQLNTFFTQQDIAIQQQQQRLDIQKKYYAEFSALLTPQQVLKIYQPQYFRQNQNRNGNSREGNRNRGDFPGGGFPTPPSDAPTNFGGGGFGGGFGGSDGF